MTEEKDLATLFEELRRFDEASAPPLARVLARAAGTPAEARRFRVLPIAALVVVLAATLVAVRVSRRGPSTRPREPEAAIAAWSSPTDWLLSTPGRELWSEVPALVEPLAAAPFRAEDQRTPTRTTRRKGEHS